MPPRMTPRRTRRRVASCAAVLSVLAASPLAAQKATTPDFSGTWVLDSIKSDFAGTPVPKNDTSKITRVGNVYHMEQVGDFGPRAGGLQRLTYSWPAGNGEVTNDLPQGATMHVKTKLSADTSTFFVECRHKVASSCANPAGPTSRSGVRSSCAKWMSSQCRARIWNRFI